MKTLKRIWFWSKIIWRKWDEMECDCGYKHILRINRETAWKVTKIVVDK